jgi:hypothetical protein
MKKEKNTQTVLLIGLLLLLLLSALSLLLFPANGISDRENRTLAAFPALSDIKEGNLSGAMEKYLVDRFPLRHAGRTLHTLLELSLGKTEVQDTLLCRDGSLSARPAPNDRKLAKNLTAIRSLKEESVKLGKPFTLGVVPTRAIARREVLPPLYKADTAPYWSTFTAFPEAQFLLMTARDEEWFKTDHHWTAEGAFAAYVALGKALGYAPYPESAFEKQTVGDRFFGTADACVTLPFTTPDRITLWRYEGDESFLVTCEGTPPVQGFYRIEKLSTRDGYGVFFGGNVADCRIDKGEGDTRPLLLVFKDSYANALLPFLARHFRLHVIDPRYGTFHSDSLIKEADRLLVLAGMLSLSETGLF